MNTLDNVAYKCSKCERITYPKRAVCLKCGSREFKTINFTSECTLVTFSNIYQLPWGINDLFLTIGVVQFDNGIKTMGRISSPDVKIGMKLKAKWQLIRQIYGEDVYGWMFEPVKTKSK